MSKNLIPERYDQHDLFICDVADAVLKDLLPQLEHPFYSLSKKPDKNKRRYEHNGNYLEVLPGYKGLATIYDKDILIYCISQVMAGVKENGEIKKRVRINASDLLMFINRGTTGQDYISLCDAIDRLAGTQIVTNIKTGDQEQRDSFSLINSSSIRRKDGLNGRLLWMEVELSDWVINAIKAKEVLTLSRDYFRLRKPIERRIYELARKHCGNQREWHVGLELLHKKSGARSELKKFRYLIKNLVKGNYLPDYFIEYNKEKDRVRFINKNINFTPIEWEHMESNASNASSVRPFTPQEYERAKKACPGLDIYAMENMWRMWCESKKEEINDPVGAFIGFCRKLNQN